MASLQKPLSRRSALLPWLVLAAAIGLTVAAWWLAQREVTRTAQARFDRLTERVQNSLLRRFDTAALLLHGAAAFPEASDRVSAADWSLYLRKISTELGSGVVGLGYVERVARSDADALEARLQAEGETGFKVERGGNGDWLYVVLGIEPREHNTDVLGLDIASGVTRRTAAETAAKENSLILTRRIRINYDHREVPGFLLFLPVYEKGADLSGPEKRMEGVRGWVYAAIRIDQLMTGVVDRAADKIDFAVFEGGDAAQGNLLYAPAGSGSRSGSDPAMRSEHSMEIYGRLWTIAMTPRPDFVHSGVSSVPPWVLGVGLGFSLLVTLLTWMLVNSRTRALKLAGDMTTDLRRLALVASHTGSGVIITDPEWRVVWINQGFTRLFGYTLDEIKGRGPGSFMTGPDTDRGTVKTMETEARARRRFLGEILFYTRDGRKVWIELEIQPVVREDGELEGFMGLQLDITERKRQAEQMREAMEAAEKANQAKSQFLAMMSHEIRTPMNGVIGMTSLLLDSPLTPAQHEYAEIIRQSGESLLTLINDILDFSKIESGRLELERANFNVRECVESALDLLATRASQKNLDLLLDCPEEIPAEVRGDVTRLRQIIVNLVGNAIKFTERGEIEVDVRIKTADETGTELQFSVRDTGIGIPAEAQGRLFAAFAQVDASTTRKYGGTGLGLAVSRRLAELMGGRMWVESVPGQGSTFHFTIRVEPAVRSSRSPLPTPRPRLDSLNVLVVDDNATNRRLVCELLIRWGLRPVAAESGEAALRLLEEGRAFDCAILDRIMPGMDGIMLARAIRRLPARAQMPLLMLTSVRDNSLAAEPELFTATLTKPAKPAQLFRELARMLGAPEAVPAAPLAAPAQAAVEQRHERILLAEDNSVNQKVALHMLARLGYRADLAANGLEAVAAVQRQTYDIILMDVQMPEMDGLQATRQIRSRLAPGNPGPWIIALTANAMQGDREVCLAHGMDDYLSKPLKPGELAAALARAPLGRQQG